MLVHSEALVPVFMSSIQKSYKNTGLLLIKFSVCSYVLYTHWSKAKYGFLNKTKKKMLPKFQLILYIIHF